ncbi:MAG: PorP/SprF family type IX secretion system membrane protein [Chitinophagales bacterium]
MKKALYTFLVSMIVANGAVAQSVGGATDPHFSQFYAAPLLLNPALTGAMSCNYRLTAIFRGQWGSVLRDEATPMFQTPSASIDFRTNRAFGQKDAFGIGFAFMNDKAGQSRYQTNLFNLSIAYHKSLDRRAEHFLTLGFGVQVLQRSIDYRGLQWGLQNDDGTYNGALPTGEYLVNNSFLIPDVVNFGLLYTGKFGRRSSGYVGFSAFHMTRPKESFLGDVSVRIPMKFTAHAGFRFPIKGRFDMQPKVIYMNQGVSHELNPGFDIRVLFAEREPEGNNFRLGLMYRIVGGDTKAAWKDGVLNSEALIINAGVEFNNLNIGVAYDVNTSQLISGSRAQGAFEIAASYVGCFKKRRPQTIYCPKF